MPLRQQKATLKRACKSLIRVNYIKDYKMDRDNIYFTFSKKKNKKSLQTIKTTKSSLQTVTETESSLTNTESSLTIKELKFLYLISIHINKEDIQFKEYKFKITNIFDLLEIKNINKYEELEKLTASLTTKRLTIYDEALKLTIATTWLAQAIYEDNKELVKIRFAPVVKPYLLQLQSVFKIKII